MTPNRPSSTQGGTIERGDWIARQFVSPTDLRLTPEEYVARHSHLLGAFGFARLKYDDQALGIWVRRVAELLADRAEIERCRSCFLSPEEIAAARRLESEDL